MKLILQLLSYSFLLILVLVPGKGDDNSHPTSNEFDDRALGGSVPIRNLKDPEVVKAAKFAVTEHNEETNSKLVFVRVVKGEEQSVEGSLYRLTISAKDGRAAKPKLYRVEVLSRVWLKKNQLRLEYFIEIRI
ncbi:cysteine proteinase inhibitor 4 [Phtheirospermum japonicum]|uniref:Cysteine proteinase inhibitor 4 n=1 Tax=Phtheirospermum japonicum TaxID=374723 RepID=A0A830BX65_9LAMI|nr:cysteine proteinase inhibitor 4 [Phtheirospermum japonicum]